MQRAILGLVTVALAAVLGASIAHAGGSSARTASLSGPYLGTYVATLSASQANAKGDSRVLGRFRLELRANGTYSVTNPLDGTARGRLAVLSGKKLRFFKDSGCMYGGFERPQGGIYGWSMNGKKLTLRLVSEGACTGRAQSLAWVVWHRT